MIERIRPSEAAYLIDPSQPYIPSPELRYALRYSTQAGESMYENLGIIATICR